MASRPVPQAPPSPGTGSRRSAGAATQRRSGQRSPRSPEAIQAPGTHRRRGPEGFGAAAFADVEDGVGDRVEVLLSFNAILNAGAGVGGLCELTLHWAGTGRAWRGRCRPVSVAG